MTAWGELSKAHAADGGAGLAVLSDSFSVADARAPRLRAPCPLPRVQWATYDAVSDENRLAGLRSATGRDSTSCFISIRRAVILALDADPLLTDPEMIRHARGFAAGTTCGRVGRRDEPALRGRRRLLADRRHGRSSAASPEPADRSASWRRLAARLAPARSREHGGQPPFRASIPAGSTLLPRTCLPTAARG